MPDNNIYLMKFKRSNHDDQVKSRLKKLFHRAGFDRLIEKNDITAIKVHFGEKGNTNHVPAIYIEPLIRIIKSLGAKPFVTDTNVLYKSQRDNAIDHIKLAYEHGFSLDTIGAPIVIADGISGRNDIEIRIDAPINKVVSLASDIVAADSLIVITHVTGHLNTGLAATLKNLGMGMASRKGKLTQHSVSKPTISPNKCTVCGVCAEWCPEYAITLEEEFARIDEKLCTGCGECLAVCRYNAVKFKWDSSSSELQKQIAEHALGIVKQKRGKIGYFTFLITMTKDCDCMAQKPNFLIDDIGVLAGTDPIAIDQAVLDLTKNEGKKDIATLSYPSIDATIQIAYGEEIGLGFRRYNLIEEKY